MNRNTTLFEKFKSTGKHGIIYGIGAILEKAITFILIPLYTTKFSVSEYGILGIVTITGSVMVTVFDLGMNYGLLRSYYDYKDENERKAVISTSFYMVLAGAMVLAIAGVLLSRTFSVMFFDTDEYRLHFILIALISALSVLNVIPYIVFRVRMKSLQFIIFQLVFLSVGIGWIIYFVNVRGWGILGALAGNLIMGFISCITLYIYIRKDIVLKFLKYEVRKMLLIGLPLIPASLSVFVFSATNRYFLNFYRTTSEVGLYDLAFKFGNIITILLATPISMIWPAMYLSVKDDDNANDFYSRALTYFLSVSLFLFLVFSLLSREVIHIFSNEEYWDAYPIIPILVLTYSLWSIRKVINVAMTITRKTQGMAVTNVAGAALNIGLNFLMIPRFGLFGAAYATLITYIAVIVALYFYNRSLMRINYEWLRITKAFFAAGGIFALGYFIGFESLIISIIFKIVIILLYPLVLLLLRFFTPGEKEKARNLLRKILVRLKIKSGTALKK